MTRTKGLLVLFGVSWIMTIMTLPAWAENSVSEASLSEARMQVLSGSIRSLEWSTDTITVQADSSDQPFVILKGRYNRDRYEASLLSGNFTEIRQTSPQGDFEVRAPLESSNTTLKFYAIGARGETEREEMLIVFAGWDAWAKRLKERDSSRRFRASVGLELGRADFQDSRAPSFSQEELGLDLSFEENLRKRWLFEEEAQFSVLPFAASRASTVRFLDLDARFGRELTSEKKPWRFLILVGLYYSTMFVSTEDFGYRNLYGPEIYPELERVLQNGDTVRIRARFVPIGGPYSALSFSHHEVDAGVTYAFAKLKHPVSISLQLQSLSDQLGIDNTTVTLSKTSYSLGVGYEF